MRCRGHKFCLNLQDVFEIQRLKLFKIFNEIAVGSKIIEIQTQKDNKQFLSSTKFTVKGGVISEGIYNSMITSSKNEPNLE